MDASEYYISFLSVLGESLVYLIQESPSWLDDGRLFRASYLLSVINNILNEVRSSGTSLGC